METWKLDRIYTFLSAALALNPDTSRKYFFDRNDTTFFHLFFDNQSYFMKTNEVQHLSTLEKNKIIEKIKKINSKDRDILEIQKSKSKFNFQYGQQNRTKEQYDEIIIEETKLFKEIQIFLVANKIDINQTFLIE